MQNNKILKTHAKNQDKESRQKFKYLENKKIF